MAFVPATSIDPGAIVVGGVVAVSNFPADQLVHFTQPVDVDVLNFPAVQAVSVDSLPLPDGAATEATLAESAGALNDVGLTAILQRERMETE